MKLNGLKSDGVAVVARQTFHMSKLKLGDSDASAREKTKGAELFRSKQGIRRGLHVSLRVRDFPLSVFWKIFLSVLSMLLAEKDFCRRRRREAGEDLGL